MNPGFKCHYFRKRKCYFSTEGNLLYIHKYIQMQPTLIFSILEISKLLLQSCIETEPEQRRICSHFSHCSLRKNLAGLCPRFPGDCKPWNFTTDSSSVTHSGPPGLRVFYINRCDFRWPLIPRWGGHAGKANQVIKRLGPEPHPISLTSWKRGL